MIKWAQPDLKKKNKIVETVNLSSYMLSAVMFSLSSLLFP